MNLVSTIACVATRLFSRLTSAFQPRWFMIKPAADGCKRLLRGGRSRIRTVSAEELPAAFRSLVQASESRRPMGRLPSNRKVNYGVKARALDSPFPILPRFTVGATDSRPTTTRRR